MMATSEKSRSLWSAVAAIIVSCCAACDFRSNAFVAENEKIPSEQVALLHGPFVAAEMIVDRLTKNPVVVTCSKDGVVRVFDMKGRQQRQWNIDAPIGQVLLFTVSTRTDAYAAMDHNGEVVYGRLSSAKTIARGKAKLQYPRLAFSHDGMWLAAVGTDVGQVWQTAEMSECPAFLREDVSRRVNETVAFLKEGDDTLLATAAFQNDFIDLVALPSGTSVRMLHGDKRFEDLATTPDSRFLVAVTTASLNLAVWDISKGGVVARHKAFPTGIGNRLAISEDGKTLVCSQFLHSPRSRTGFRVYRVNGWTEAGLVEIKDDASATEWENLRILNVSIDSTGSSVATLHQGGQVRLWQVPTK